ncbi:hypothetical protein HZA43_02165 [Candidatus Peregrinibacteria bacterium]|nr:hypothetical protein [Candidatus Peregrinibacteria bacterium]
MKNKKRFLLSLGLVLGLSALLSACGVPKETPEQVIPKFKTALSQVVSAALSGDARITGSDPSDAIDATLTFKSKFDYADGQKNKGSADVGLKGMITRKGKKITGDTTFSFTSIGDDFYMNLTKLETDYEEIQKIKPLLTNYMNKWLHMAPDLLPENVKKLQEQPPANRDASRKLLAASNLFTVSKEYGIETVNGHESYRYGISLDRNGLREYNRQSSIIDGKELSAAELDDAVEIVDAATDVQVWIGIGDYFPYKLTALIDGNKLSSSTDLKFELALSASDFNKSPDIAAPAKSEEFNPVALLMGLSATQDGAGLPDAVPPVEE